MICIETPVKLKIVTSNDKPIAKNKYSNGLAPSLVSS